MYGLGTEPPPGRDPVELDLDTIAVALKDARRALAARDFPSVEDVVRHLMRDHGVPESAYQTDVTCSQSAGVTHDPGTPQSSAGHQQLASDCGCFGGLLVITERMRCQMRYRLGYRCRLSRLDYARWDDRKGCAKFAGKLGRARL